ncbi:hypothetical protein J437_LFUL010988 [Ladona fulva]|uniref:Protein KTI12 homolog n=1 Tax=Ladona fulva TaxID=123851 RepID=A0A8K0KM96_LADFU|nr:hypothetical protein J437_LFUL010988 [Ladona fulva]
MPLIVITGFPCSGKTRRANELKKAFESMSKTVHVVSERDALEEINKNLYYQDPAKEKEIRGILKSSAQRLLTEENVVIIDAGNYIKGFRYELYCMSKECKTTQCTVHSLLSAQTSWSWNKCRDVNEKYTKEVFDALIMRFEPPDSRNRWDNPLFTVLPEDSLPILELTDSLFARKAPPPNKSTQCEILSASKIGAEGDIKIEGCSIPFLCCSRNLSAPQLARFRRQFLAYTKMNPPRENEISSIPVLFVQFLNHRLSE